MRAVLTLALLYVSFSTGQNSLYRSPCKRIGNFSVLVKEHTLAGHVIFKYNVSSRLDCAFKCVNNGRCLSYNYEEGEKLDHGCELNSESKITKSTDLMSRPGYSYYGTGRNVPDKCASSPCINDGTCQDSCVEGSGFKCLCIDGRNGDKCQYWTDNAQNYTAAFERENANDYLETETEIDEPLAQLTACMWLKTTRKWNWMTFLSLVSLENQKHLTFRCLDTKQCRLTIIGVGKDVDLPPFNNGLWHLLCFTWENILGSWAVILDGFVMTSEKNLRVGREVGPGRLTVGKMQSGVSTPEEPFTGEIASVNVWSAKLDDSKIREMSRSKSQELGNVTDWREFRHGINGDVNILSPGSPISIVSDTEFVVDFASKSVNNYIQPSTVMPSLKHLTVSFWMKTKLLADAAIVHYATSEEINSLYVGFGPNGPLNLYVMSSSNYKRCYLPGMNGGLWHHICLTWSSFLGKVQFFLDGSRIKTISGYRENVTVPEGGILRIGQRQLEVGGSHSSIKAYEGELTRINIWNTVLADSVIEALALTPGAEIGNFLSWRDIRTSIFSGLVSIQDGADPQPLAEESNYDLLFNSKSTSNYATYSSLPPMTCLTACLWMRTSYSGTHYFFSYSTSSYYDALTLGYDSEEAEINFNINYPSWRYHALSSAFMHDDGWHHLCVTWRNTDGKWCIFVDGERKCYGESYKTGQTIAGNGKFFLGQEQDSYGGSFSTYQAFYGRMSRVNIWSNVLANDAIEKMSLGCGLVSGDVVAWHHFKNNLFGDVQVETPSWCSLIGPTKQAKLDAYCQSQFSGSSCSEGTITRAVFDRKVDQVGKKWRCYYENALTESSTGYAYDVSKSSECLHTRDNELRSLLL